MAVTTPWTTVPESAHMPHVQNLARPEADGKQVQLEALWDIERDDAVDMGEEYGVLLIEESCVYLLNYSGQDGQSTTGTRYLLRLPRSGTHHDAVSGALRIWDQGPFYSGDEVVVGGGGGTQEEWDSARCRFDYVWYTSSMHRLNDASPHPIVTQGTTASDEFWDGPLRAPLEGMTDYVLDGGQDALLEGTLLIDSPCVYLLTDAPVEVWLLSFPRVGTRYDHATGALWVWDEGPFLDGDEVKVGGGRGPSSSVSTSCTYDFVWDARGVFPPPTHEN